MNFKDRVTLTVENHVADVRLARAEKMNAIDPAMFDALVEAIDHLGRRTDVRAAVLSGEGRGFCAGLDMASMAGGELPFQLGPRSHGPANVVQQVAWGWRALPFPVIAAVHGVALGGGFQIMSGADIRLGDPQARFAIREGWWGLVPDMAGIALWRTLARDDVLRELTYTAREFDGVEAQALGFLTRTTNTPLEDALALAAEIAGRNPDAVRGAKRLFNLAADGDAAAILQAESDEQLRLLGSPNQMEAVMANLQKRAPRFTD